MYLNNKYYVIEKDNSSPIVATSYIIPDDKMGKVTINTSNKCVILHRTASYINEKLNSGSMN